MFKSLALILGLIFALPAAHGEEAIVSSFRKAAQSIPQKLVQKGYTRFGRMNLKTLIQKANSIPVVPRDEISVPGEIGDGDTRSSARWTRKSGRSLIEVSRRMWPETPKEIRPLIALHELLCAAGFNDRNYNLSSAMWLLSQSKTDRAMTFEEKDEIVTYVASRSGGGIIGVGGGGDMGGTWLKVETLRNQLSDIEHSRDPAFRRQKLSTMLVVIEMGVEFKWRWKK